MAERVMSEADDADVTGRFSQVEQERGLTGWHEGFASDVARWEQAFGGSQPDERLHLLPRSGERGRTADGA
jgi:hypothetical protein